MPSKLRVVSYRIIDDPSESLKHFTNLPTKIIKIIISGQETGFKFTELVHTSIQKRKESGSRTHV